MDGFVNEVWKVIEDFSPYEISNCGRIRNSSNGKIRKQSTSRLGYMRLVLNKNKKAYSFQVHRLVAKAFLDTPQLGRNEVNHIDGVKANNHFSNLEWVTRAENMQHAIRSGLRHPSCNRRQNIGPYKRNRQGLKGVSLHKESQKWRAYITINGKQIHLGLFTEKQEAVTAYQSAVNQYFPQG